MYSLLLNTVFFGILVWSLQTLWKRRKLYIYSWNVPGPFALPLFGNSYLFITDLHELICRVNKLIEIYPGLVRIWFGPVLTYMLSKPEYIEKISNVLLDRHDIYRLTDFPGVDGLLCARVKVWKRHRKLLMPSFSQNMLDSYMDIFNTKAEVLCEQLDKHVGKKYTPLIELVSRCTMDILCGTAMGIEMNSQTTDSDYHSTVNSLIEMACIRAVYVTYHYDLIWMLSPYGKKWNKSLKVLRQFNSSVVTKKIEEQMEIQSENIVVDSRRRVTFVDLLIKSKSFTEKEIIDEIETMLVTGTETTAVTLVNMILALAMNQDVQEKAYREVIEILGSDGLVEPQNLSLMKYSERVLKETLRLLPTVPAVARRTDTDFRLDEKYTIPEGAAAVIYIVQLHRNPEYWSDPMTFDPDRFLPENVAKRNAYTYLPFMSGPRNCIGGRYAIISVMTMFAHLIRKYKFFTEYKTMEEVEFIPFITLKLRDGAKLWMERRQPTNT